MYTLKVKYKYKNLAECKAGLITNNDFLQTTSVNRQNIGNIYMQLVQVAFARLQGGCAAFFLYI